MSFFDSLDRAELAKMLETRAADGSLLRLIGKCLRVAVLEGVDLSAPEFGTAQGSVLSPAEAWLAQLPQLEVATHEYRAWAGRK